MARLDHPNVVRVYGGCLTPPNLFVVVELMACDLSSRIHRREEDPSRLTLSQALTLALHIAKGLVGTGGHQSAIYAHFGCLDV